MRLRDGESQVSWNQWAKCLNERHRDHVHKFAMNWAERMENYLERGERLDADILNLMAQRAGRKGLSNGEYVAAVAALGMYWKYSEAFRQIIK